MSFAIMLRVARGAQLLDKKEPGWWRQINLDRFDIYYTHRCVIGQVFGDSYNEFITHLGLDILNNEDHDYGFDLTDSWEGAQEERARLNHTWTEVIQARRAAFN